MLFVLFSVAFLSLAKSQNLTVYDFDNVAAKLFTFGDPNNSFPINSIEAESLCAQYSELAPLALPFMSDIFQSFGITGNNNFTADVVCKMYRDSPIDMINFAVEVNNKTDQMAEFRQNYYKLRAYVANGKAGHDFCLNYPQMGCYLLSWYNGTSNLLSEPSKLIMNKISAFHLEFADSFSPLPTCDYSIIPVSPPTAFQSFDMNYLVAVKNCFTIY